MAIFVYSVTDCCFILHQFKPLIGGNPFPYSLSLWVLLDFLPISSNKSLHYWELNLDKFNIILCRNHVRFDKYPTFPDIAFLTGLKFYN